MARLAIFTSEERRLFELPPLFNSVDRKRFFFLQESLLKETKHFNKPHNKVCDRSGAERNDSIDEKIFNYYLAPY